MATDKQHKIPNAPNLRFPGFEDEWKNHKVSDLLNFFPTNSLSWEQLVYDIDSIQNLHYGLIHVGLPTSVNLKHVKLPCIKNEFIPRNYELCKNGDVAFADASEDTNDVAKAIEFTDLDNKMVVCGLHTIHGRDKGNLTISGFKGYAFASPAFHNQIRRIAQGTKVFSISNKNFDECVIGIPLKEEQRKIADLFTLIDDRIQTQIGAIEDYKKLKEYLIDKLIKQQDYTMKIGDVIVQRAERNKKGDNYTVLSVSNQKGFIAQSEQFEEREVASEDKSNYKIVRRDDFAYNPARINVGSIARLTNYDGGIVSPMYICFHTYENVLSEFLDYFFESRYFAAEVEKRLEGSVRLCLSYDGLCDIPIQIPNVEKQRAIIQKLDAVSQKIVLEEQCLDLYKQQKDYLLKNMFV